MLFPTLNAAQMEGLANSLARESDVNDFWNAILHRFFNPPMYFIKTEVRVDFNHIPDLVISRSHWQPNGQVVYQPIALYEGKGPGAETWFAVRTQLAGYGHALLANGRGVYCIGGRGRQISFWYFRKGDSMEMKPMDIERRSGRPRFRDTSEMPPQYDLVNDYVAIGQLMNFIVLNAPQ